MRTLCMMAAWLALAGSAFAQPTGWMTAGDYGGAHIVVAEDAPDAVRQAAVELQRYWQQCTGDRIGISAKPRQYINIWLGPESITDPALMPAELELTGPAGYVLRSWSPTMRYREQGAQRQLIMAGNTPAGTVNCVYGFLRDAFRCRWFTPEVARIPRAPWTAGPFDQVFEPPFPYRALDLRFLWRQHTEGLAFERSQHFQHAFSPQPFVRSNLEAWLPRERFAHLYAEAGPLPCFSREDVALAIAGEIRALASSPAERDSAAQAARRAAVAPDAGRRWWYIAPDAAQAPCGCEACTALARESGSPSGPLLRMANRVSAALEADSEPGTHAVLVFADGPYRAPPRQLEPAPGVWVLLSTQGCDHGLPLEEAGSEPNMAFARDLRGWPSLGRRLMVWDFAHDPGAPLAYFPAWETYQANLRFYDQYGVGGVYYQAATSAGAGAAPFAELRAYILARLLWDPDILVDQEMAAFIEASYGKAAPQMQAVADALLQAPYQFEPSLALGDGAPWWDLAFARGLAAHFEEALALDLREEIRRRVEREQLGARHALLMVLPASDSESMAALRDGAAALRRDLALHVPQASEAELDSLLAPVIGRLADPGAP